MDNENIENLSLSVNDESSDEHVKMQNDLLKLIQVLDDCIENVDNFYCYAAKKQMLATSNSN